MELNLKDKVALVTGASDGIGKACALSLAKEECKLIVCSRDRERIKKAALDIEKKAYCKVDYQVCDVSQKEDIKVLYDYIIKKYGAMHILVNNTGGPPHGGLFEHEDEIWLKAFENTVMSVVRFTKLVLPIMRKQKFGRIINIESTSVKQTIPYLLLSNSIRPSVIGFSKSISNEVASDNVTINNIAPGTIDTQRLRELTKYWGETKNLTEQEMLDDLKSKSPINRLGLPKEIGDVAAFLASENAAFITGTIMIVDGGRIRGVF